jgi:hypothetical protein
VWLMAGRTWILFMGRPGDAFECGKRMLVVGDGSRGVERASGRAGGHVAERTGVARVAVRAGGPGGVCLGARILEP